MKKYPIQEALKLSEGYVISFQRNTTKGYYELKVGLPKEWIYDDNEEVKCTILNETDSGKILLIEPQKEDIVIDHLIIFLNKLINVNNRIAERKKEIEKQIENHKAAFEKQVEILYEELNNQKISSLWDEEKYGADVLVVTDNKQITDKPKQITDKSITISNGKKTKQ